MKTVDFKYLENVTSVEFVERIKNEVNNGARVVSINPSDFYVYVDLFDGCFEHFAFDPDTKKYTVNYVSLPDVNLYVDYMKKENLMRP